MLPKIQKILYATDLSPNSAYAFRYTINTASKHDAEIILLHVIEQIPASTRVMIDLYASEGEEYSKRIERNIKAYIDKMKARIDVVVRKELNDSNQQRILEKISSIEVCEGYPAHEILKRARDLGCDVIIMGNHGKGFISHAFLGSVAEKVLRRTTIPVFVIPIPDGITEMTFHDLENGIGYARG